ncbi:MAG: hypothetical protein R3354_06885 [Thiohalomonadales bacterium]|nr:hypothetical protein [Thiohalomonadales bacterium]
MQSHIQALMIFRQSRYLSRHPALESITLVFDPLICHPGAGRGPVFLKGFMDSGMHWKLLHAFPVFPPSLAVTPE